MGLYQFLSLLCKLPSYLTTQIQWQVSDTHFLCQILGGNKGDDAKDNFKTSIFDGTFLWIANLYYTFKNSTAVFFKTHFSNQINIFLIPTLPNAMKMYFAYKHIVTNERLLRSKNLMLQTFFHFFLMESHHNYTYKQYNKMNK